MLGSVLSMHDEAMLTWFCGEVPPFDGSFVRGSFREFWKRVYGSHSPQVAPQSAAAGSAGQATGA